MVETFIVKHFRIETVAFEFFKYGGHMLKSKMATFLTHQIKVIINPFKRVQIRLVFLLCLWF